MSKIPSYEYIMEFLSMLGNRNYLLLILRFPTYSADTTIFNQFFVSDIIITQIRPNYNKISEFAGLKIVIVK